MTLKDAALRAARKSGEVEGGDPFKKLATHVAQADLAARAAGLIHAGGVPGVAAQVLRMREVIRLREEYEQGMYPDSATGLVSSFPKLLRLYYPKATKSEMEQMTEWAKPKDLAPRRRQWSEGEKEQIGMIFDAVDTDSGGSIDMEEFLLLAEGAGMAEAELKRIFTDKDVDNSGELDRDEFIECVEQCKLFDHFDDILRRGSDAKDKRKKDEYAAIWTGPGSGRLARAEAVSKRPCLADTYAVQNGGMTKRHSFNP